MKKSFYGLTKDARFTKDAALIRSRMFTPRVSAWRQRPLLSLAAWDIRQWRLRQQRPLRDSAPSWLIPLRAGIADLPAVQEIQVWPLGQEDLLEKGMAAHSSILAWKIPWTEELDGLYHPWGQESDATEQLTLPHSWTNKHQLQV